jgi:hypothetical protein
MRCVFVGTGVRPDPVNAVLFQPMNNNLLIVNYILCVHGLRAPYIQSCTMSGAVNIVNMSTGKQLQTAGARTDACAMCMCVEQQSRTLWVGTNDGYVHAFHMHPTTSALTVAHKYGICCVFIYSSQQDTHLCITYDYMFECARVDQSRSARSVHTGQCGSEHVCVVQVCCILSSHTCTCLFRIGASNGSLQFVRKFPINHERLPYLRSNFCPLMSFREGACVRECKLCAISGCA